MSYFIIGGDGKQYGPITAEQVRGWFAQQRLNGQSQVRPENVPEWRTLRTLPEFADLFTPPQMAGAPATPGWSAPPPASTCCGLMSGPPGMIVTSRPASL